MAWQNIGEYNQKFRAKSEQIKAGPVESRACTQWGCLILFALIFLATFGGGAYFIYAGRSEIQAMLQSTQSGEVSSGFGFIMARLAGPIVGMMILSAALSVGVVVMARFCAKATIYMLMGFTFLVYIGLAILGFASGNLALGIVFAICTAMLALFLCCMWQYLKVGIKLLQCASRFIVEKPAVYFISLMCLVLNTAFIVFWIFSWLGVYSSGVIDNSQTMRILSYVWYADAVFWGFFLYYCMAFLVSSACAYWYYQSQNNSVLRGMNNIKYHFGSICFGAIVITIITMMRTLAKSRNAKGIGALVAAFVACILGCIQDIVKVLNSYSIIVMAVTAEGYIQSAKSAVSLIFDNLSLFIILDYFGNFYNLFAFTFASLLPGLIGGGIIYKTYTPQQDPNLVTYSIYGGIIIFLLSLVISSIIIGMLNQALNSIYVFYCFDNKFRNMGIPVNNIPNEIKEIFGEGAQNQKAHQASLQYINGS